MSVKGKILDFSCYPGNTNKEEYLCYFSNCVAYLTLQEQLSGDYAVMADAFSSSSENVIQRVVEVTAKTNVPVEKLDELYYIKKTCDFISQHQFQKVETSF